MVLLAYYRVIHNSIVHTLSLGDTLYFVSFGLVYSRLRSHLGVAKV